MEIIYLIIPVLIFCLIFAICYDKQLSINKANAKKEEVILVCGNDILMSSRVRSELNKHVTDNFKVSHMFGMRVFENDNLIGLHGS